MPLHTGSHFHHRGNRDGCQVSTCARCYFTVAIESSESELVLQEETHICDSVTAYQVSQYAHRVIAIMDSFAGRTQSNIVPQLGRMSA